MLSSPPKNKGEGFHPLQKKGWMLGGMTRIGGGGWGGDYKEEWILGGRDQIGLAIWGGYNGDAGWEWGWGKERW